MRGEKQVGIRILGMNNQLLDDQSIDGLCDSIVNLKPKGSKEKPYWAPFEKINALRNESDIAFAYEFGINSITDSFWQVRNFAGEYSEDPNGSLKRLLVLCQNESRKCIDILDPDTWEVVKTQALPQDGVYTWSCTRLDEVTIISISNNKKPFLLFTLIDDSFIPQGWPETPSISLSSTVKTFTATQRDAGQTEGVMREATDQWFLATWAFRLFDGTHVKHYAPTLVKVSIGPNTEGVLPVFTLNGYTSSENLLINQPFWKSLIAGISVCCTVPRNTEKAVLDDGAFFEVGYWPYIDKVPTAEWPTAENPNIIISELKSDAWPTGRNLGIDNFTHHKFSSRVVDTYNKRLLLGGRSIDFTLPKIETNATNNTVPGGVYSDYMDYVSGISTFSDLLFDSDGNSVSSFDPPYAYETNIREYDASFAPKAGREFKSVTIVSSLSGAGTSNPPGGPIALAQGDYSAAIVSGNLVFSITTTETNYSSGGQFVLGASMEMEVQIGPTGGPADETIFFNVGPNGNTAPFFGFSGMRILNDNITVGARIYHVITIKTDSGTYKRILSGDISDLETTVSVPKLIWYPDRRAIKYELIVQNGAVYELAISKQLNQHPESNYSYVYMSTAEQTYTIGASLITTTEPDLSVNSIFQYIPNLIQASVSGSPFIFDPAASYRVGNRENDTILGFGINLNPTSEGQAGQYPVYAFSDKGVWALEQTGDPEIAFGRISPVSNFNGINNPYAITNAGQLIIATDNKYIYALAGLESSRIDEAIANDPDYKNYLRQVRIGYHRATDYEEVIFSNPLFPYSLCYNLKYKVWYKATERFKFFFYDYPELMGLTVDNVLKDFSSKSTQQPVNWLIQTRPIHIGSPFEFKRLFPFYIRMRMKQPPQANPENYSPINFRLKGYKDSGTIVYDLYNVSVKTSDLIDYRVYNQFGSMYAYRIAISGSSYHDNGHFDQIELFYERRYEVTRRRLNISAQYQYIMEDSEIILPDPCCQGDQPVIWNQPTAQQTVTIPGTYHNFERVPYVDVLDMDGYRIDPSIQINLSTYAVTIVCQPAIPYKVMLH